MKNCPHCNAAILDGVRFCPRCGTKQASPPSDEERSRNPYLILQVALDADPEVINAAYRSLARKYHPDLNSNASDQDRMKEINWAHNMLTDPVKRRDWDQRYGTGRYKPSNPQATTATSPSSEGPNVGPVSAVQTGTNARTDTSRPGPPSLEDVPTRPVQSSSPLLWIGLGLIGLLVLVYLVPRSGGGQASAFVTDVPTSASIAIPLDSPTLMPTQGPNPTDQPPPTAAPVPANPLLNSGCIKWSNVGPQDAGRSVCVYGVVVLTTGGSPQDPYTIQFSNNWHDFKVQDFNYYYSDIQPGICIVVNGTVADNVSFLIILPNKSGDGIRLYKDANDCR